MSIKEIEQALKRARKIETILKGENPSPEKEKAAEKLAEEHFLQLADLKPILNNLEGND